MPRVVDGFFYFAEHHQSAIGSAAISSGTVAFVVGSLCIIGYCLPHAGIGAMGNLPVGIPVTVLGIMVGGMGLSIICLRSKEYTSKNSGEFKEPDLDEPDLDTWAIPRQVSKYILGEQKLEEKGYILNMNGLRNLMFPEDNEASIFVDNMIAMIPEGQEPGTVAFKFTIPDVEEGSDESKISSSNEQIIGYFYVNEAKERNKWVMFLNTPASMVLSNGGAKRDNPFLMSEGWNRFTYGYTNDDELYLSCYAISGCSKLPTNKRRLVATRLNY